MGEREVEVVKRCFEAAAAGDFEGALAAYSEDAEWDDTEVRPDGGLHRGRSAVAERARTWMGTFSEYSFELGQVLDAGEHVVVLYRDRGRGRTSGAEVEHHWGLLLTVDRGTITRHVFYADPETALEAAGLQP